MTHTRSWLQRTLYKLFPNVAPSMEAESRRWMLQCKQCGNEVSYWDIGGVRWKAYSAGKVVGMRCAACGKFSGHRVYYKKPAADEVPATNSTAA